VIIDDSADPVKATLIRAGDRANSDTRPLPHAVTLADRRARHAQRTHLSCATGGAPPTIAAAHGPAEPQRRRATTGAWGIRCCRQLPIERPSGGRPEGAIVCDREESPHQTISEFSPDEGQHLDDLARNALLGSSGGEVLGRDRYVADLAAHRPGDFLDRLPELEESWTGELVELADVPIVGQRRDRDVGDVVGVDERLGRVSGRKRDLVALNHLPPVVLAEVLGEPGRAQDSQLGAGGPYGRPRKLGLFLAAPGQQNETPKRSASTRRDIPPHPRGELARRKTALMSQSTFGPRPQNGPENRSLIAETQGT